MMSEHQQLDSAFRINEQWNKELNARASRLSSRESDLDKREDLNKREDDMNKREDDMNKREGALTEQIRNFVLSSKECEEALALAGKKIWDQDCKDKIMLDFMKRVMGTDGTSLYDHYLKFEKREQERERKAARFIWPPSLQNHNAAVYSDIFPGMRGLFITFYICIRII